MSSKEGGGLEIDVRKLPDNDTKVIPGEMMHGWSMVDMSLTLQWVEEPLYLCKKYQNQEIYLWILMYLSLKKLYMCCFPTDTELGKWSYNYFLTTS